MTAPATLAERRAALKRLLASGESAIDAYERVLEGASEKDRRSLFKSVPFTRLVPPAVEWEWDAAPEDAVRLCVFLRAALAGRDDAGDDYGARWSGRRGGDPREGADLERLLAAYRCGAAQRSGEWLEEAAGSPGGVAFWHTYRTILAERGAYLTSAPSLEYFARRIIPAPHPTSDETQRFFEENPTFLDHEFWQFFRVEGALPGSALFVRMYREDPSAPGGDFERLHSHDLVRYMATRLPQLRPRILSECLAAQRRDFSAYNARVFSRAWEALEPTREEKVAAASDLIALLGAGPSPTVFLAHKALVGLVGELSVEQVDALVQVSARVLARTEKKLLRAHLRLLAALVKARPGCAAAVSDVVAGAEFPLDLRDRAAAFVAAPTGSGDSDGSADPADEAGAGSAGTAALGATAQGREPGEGAQASWTFPDAPAADLPRTTHTAELPANNDAAVAALHALFEDVVAGAALPALLTRISGEGIELAEADKALLAKYWRSAPNWKGANQLSYLASRLLRDVAVKDAPEAGHFRGYRRKGSEWEQHRGPVRLLHEQLRVVMRDKPYDKPNGQDMYRFDPILTEPLEPMEVQWERQIIRAPYQKPVSVVRGEYTKTDDMHETWVIPGQTPASHGRGLAGGRPRKRRGGGSRVHRAAPGIRGLPVERRRLRVGCLGPPTQPGYSGRPRDARPPGRVCQIPAGHCALRGDRARAGGGVAGAGRAHLLGPGVGVHRRAGTLSGHRRRGHRPPRRHRAIRPGGHGWRVRLPAAQWVVRSRECHPDAHRLRVHLGSGRLPRRPDHRRPAAVLGRRQGCESYGRGPGGARGRLRREGVRTR